MALANKQAVGWNKNEDDFVILCPHCRLPNLVGVSELTFVVREQAQEECVHCEKGFYISVFSTETPLQKSIEKHNAKIHQEFKEIDGELPIDAQAEANKEADDFLECGLPPEYH